MLHLLNLPQPLLYISIVLIALVLVIISIPSIIHVANNRYLFDDFDTDRKVHKEGIARLGGVAIFCSFMITNLLIPELSDFEGAKVLLAACMILFVVGLKDDMSGVNPSTKFGMQLVVALMMVFLADVRLTSLYGVFNIHDLPYSFSVALSVLVIMFLTNAFNLIDGIDGLAGTTGLVVNTTFGIFFIRMGETGLACIALSLAGACVGFLKYNLTPARIFMGDTGSLLLGFVSVVLGIQFVELNKVGEVDIIAYSSAPAIAVAVLIGPIFDAIRVFILRIIKKESPFAGDRNHVHHRLLYVGMSHLQATAILLTFNLMMIGTALLLKGIGNFILIGILFLICMIFNLCLTFFVRSKERRAFRLINFFW